MIQLTRLNGKALVINSDLIKYAEAAPDTMLTLIHGEKILVREECDEVIARVTAYRARLLAEAGVVLAKALPFTPFDSMSVAASGLRASNAIESVQQVDADSLGMEGNEHD
jgi:flagellar protein FlbD